MTDILCECYKDIEMIYAHEIKPVRIKNRTMDVSWYSAVINFYNPEKNGPDDDWLSAEYLKNKAKIYFGDEPGKIALTTGLGMGHYFKARRDDKDKEIELYGYDIVDGSREDFYNGYDMMTNNLSVLTALIRKGHVKINNKKYTYDLSH